MLQRSEIQMLADKGLRFSDPFEIISLFEERVSAYMGAPYGVAVDCCTHAIELCLRYLKAQGPVAIPKNTYPSIPMTVLKLNAEISWTDEKWQRYYKLSPHPVLDASLCFEKISYVADSFMCLSFQQKKTLPIGRGGMILTSDKNAAAWFKKASYDGRSRHKKWKEDPIQMLGFHYYMTPEDAARGILLLEELGANPVLTGGFSDYPDISQLPVFKTHGH